MRRAAFGWAFAPLLFGLAACEEPERARVVVVPPPPPAAVVVVAQNEDEPASAPPDAPPIPRPRPTGDRERDALELGFWGCHVMGVRLVPGMSGRAELRATLGPSGEVVDVAAVRVEDLPRPVVDCLLQRLARAHFDPRGGAGSILDVPVDFTRSEAPVRPTLGSAVPTQTL